MALRDVLHGCGRRSVSAGMLPMAIGLFQLLMFA